jgi:hypothetical protein
MLAAAAAAVRVVLSHAGWVVSSVAVCTEQPGHQAAFSATFVVALCSWLDLSLFELQQIVAVSIPCTAACMQMLRALHPSIAIPLCGRLYSSLCFRSQHPWRHSNECTE